MRRSSQRSSSVATSASIPLATSSHPHHPHRHHHPSSSPSPNQISCDRFSSSPSPSSSPSIFPFENYLKRYPSILYCNNAKLLSGQPQLVAVCHIASLLSEEEDNNEQDREDSCLHHHHHSTIIDGTSFSSASSSSSSSSFHHYINSSVSVNDVSSSFSLSSVEKGGVKNGIRTDSVDSSHSQEGRRSNASDPSSSSRTSSSLSSSSSSPSLVRRNRSRHLTAPIPLLLYTSATGGDIAVEETTERRRGKGRTVKEKGGVEEEEFCEGERGLINHRSYSELSNYGDFTEKGGDEVDDNILWRNEIKCHTEKKGNSNVGNFYSLPGSRGRRGRSITDASLYDTAVIGNSSSVLYEYKNTIMPTSSVAVTERSYFLDSSSEIKRTASGEKIASVGNSSLDVSDVSSSGRGGGGSSVKSTESHDIIRKSLCSGRYTAEVEAAAVSPSSSSSPMNNLRGNSRINASVGGGRGGGGGERRTVTGVNLYGFPCTSSTSTSSSGDVSGNAGVRTYSASRKSNGNDYHSSWSSGIPISSFTGGGGGGGGRLEGSNYVAVAGRSLLQVLSVDCSDADVSFSSSSPNERFSLCPRYTYSKSHVQCLGWRRGIPLTLATLAADGALTCYMKIKKLGGWRPVLTIKHPHSRAGTCMEWIGGTDKICCGFMDGAIKVFDVSTAYSSAVTAAGGGGSGGNRSGSGSSGRSGGGGGGGGGGGTTVNGSGSGGGKGGYSFSPLLEIKLGSVCVRDLHSRFYSSCGSQTWMSNEVLAAADDGMAHIYDLRMDTRHTLHGKAQSYLVSTQALTSARWSCHDSNMFAAASREGIHLWDIRRSDGRPVGMIKTLFPCRCLRWRPGYPTQLASCAAIVDECISLWDLQNPTLPISIFPGHSEIVRDFDWLDEYRLLSCGLDKRLILHSADRSLQPLTHMTTASVCWSPTDSSPFTLESPFYCSAPSSFGKCIIPPFSSIPDSSKQSSFDSSSSSPRAAAAALVNSSSPLSSPHLPSSPPKFKWNILSTERLTVQFCRFRRPPDNRLVLSSSTHSLGSSTPTYYEQRGFVADLGLSRFPVAEITRSILSPKPITHLLRSFRGSAFPWLPSNSIADKFIFQTRCFPSPLPFSSSAPSSSSSSIPLASSSSSSGGIFPPSLSSQMIPPFPISHGFLSSSPPPPSRCLGYGVMSSTDILSYIHYMSQIDVIPDFNSTVTRLRMNVLRPWLQGMLVRQMHQRFTFRTLQFVRHFMSQGYSSSPFSSPLSSFSSSTFSSHMSPSLFPSTFSSSSSSSSFSKTVSSHFPSAASFSSLPAASASVNDELVYPTLFSKSTSAPLLYALQASGMFSSSSFSAAWKDDASNLSSSGISSGNASFTADLEDFGRSNFDSYHPCDDISYSSILNLSDHELQKFVFHNLLLDARSAQHQQQPNTVKISSSSSSSGKYSQYVDSLSISRGSNKDSSNYYPSFSSSCSSPSPSPSSSSLSPGMCRTSQFSLPQSLPSGGEALALPFHEICHLYSLLCSQVGEVGKTQVWEYLAVLYDPNPFVSLQLMFGHLADLDPILSIFRLEKFPYMLEAASSFGTLEKLTSFPSSSVITSSSSLLISSAAAAAEDCGEKGEILVGNHHHHRSSELKTLNESEKIKKMKENEEENHSTVESFGGNFESFLRMCSSGCAEISAIVDILNNESFLGKWLEIYRRDLIYPIVDYYMKKNDVHMCLALIMNMTATTSYASQFLKSSITSSSSSVPSPPSSSLSIPTVVSNKSSSSSSSSITTSSSSAVSSASSFQRNENWEGWRPLLISWSFGYVELLRRLRLRVEAVRFICCSPFERIRELGREGLTEGCFACSESVTTSPISSQGSGGGGGTAAAGGAGTSGGGGGRLCGKAVERLPFRSSSFYHNSSSTNSSGNSSSNNGGIGGSGGGGGGIMGSFKINTPAVSVCSKCKKSKNICAVCGKQVQGLWVSCPVCLHGGHPSHFRIWFEKNKQIYCPSGCGHQCQL